MATSYDFLKRLGSGNFGEVWLAHDTGLGCDCALKCIPRDKVIDPSNFYHEAKILKTTEHPNIVKVLETGDLADGRVYVAMEYLRNGSLEDEAQGGYVSLSRAKAVLIDVLRALEYAHSKGIVHRDIKPANIMIGNAKEGKLSDFGLALPRIIAGNTSNLKQYQYFMHLAPEVDRFLDHTPLSDIYASGVTLYRLVNGDSYLPQLLPFEARAQAKLGKFPDRSRYREFVPRALKVIINRAMHIDPARRYQSAKEMRHALEQIAVTVDWNEVSLPNGGKKWTAHRENMYFRVARTMARNGTWSVTLWKGSNPLALRKDNSVSLDGIAKGDAIRAAKEILTAFVTGNY